MAKPQIVVLNDYLSPAVYSPPKLTSTAIAANLSSAQYQRGISLDIAWSYCAYFAGVIVRIDYSICIRIADYIYS